MRRTISIIAFLSLLALPAIASAATHTKVFSPGTHEFTVPDYKTLTVTVKGGGGGGSGGAKICKPCTWLGITGEDGGDSKFSSVTAYGGDGAGTPPAVIKEVALHPAKYYAGWDEENWASLYEVPYNGKTYSCCDLGFNGPGGTNSGASGGDRNITGGGGVGGSAGHAAIQGKPGGAGGKAIKTYAKGALSRGQKISVTVGAGGIGGHRQTWGLGLPADSGINPGGTGERGSVTIVWTDADPPTPKPTCNITVSPDSVPKGDSANLVWRSTNADVFNITNVGPVSKNGSSNVRPDITTVYTGTVTGEGGSNTCTATLTVVPQQCPANKVLHNGVCVSECPSGYEQQGRQCVRVCAADEILQNGQCVPSCAFDEYLDDGQCKKICTPPEVYVNGQCQPAQCVPGQSSCQGSDLYITNQSCERVFVRTCTYGCSEGACRIDSGSIQFVPSIRADGLLLNGHLFADPKLVRVEDTTRLFWNVRNARTCSVEGSNGDSWNTFTSGPTGVETAKMQSRTTYTLACDGFDASHVEEIVTVNVVPVFDEL